MGTRGQRPAPRGRPGHPGQPRPLPATPAARVASAASAPPGAPRRENGHFRRARGNEATAARPRPPRSRCPGSTGRGFLVLINIRNMGVLLPKSTGDGFGLNRRPALRVPTPREVAAPCPGSAPGALRAPVGAGWLRWQSLVFPGMASSPHPLGPGPPRGSWSHARAAPGPAGRSPSFLPPLAFPTVASPSSCVLGTTATCLLQSWELDAMSHLAVSGTVDQPWN